MSLVTEKGQAVEINVGVTPFVQNTFRPVIGLFEDVYFTQWLIVTISNINNLKKLEIYIRYYSLTGALKLNLIDKLEGKLLDFNVAETKSDELYHYSIFVS